MIDLFWFLSLYMKGCQLTIMDQGICSYFDLMIIIINMAYYLFGRGGSQVNGSLTHLASRHGVRDDHHCRYRTHVLSAGLPVFLLL